jgi:hypothetical protein
MLKSSPATFSSNSSLQVMILEAKSPWNARKNVVRGSLSTAFLQLKKPDQIGCMRILLC